MHPLERIEQALNDFDSIDGWCLDLAAILDFTAYHWDSDREFGFSVDSETRRYTLVEKVEKKVDGFPDEA